MQINETFTFYLIRHGQTAGNQRKAYIGCMTDEVLTEQGIEELSKSGLSGLSALNPDLVFSGPLTRCTQSAKCLFPSKQIRIVKELTEIDFGAFEGKNYEDLKNDPEYIRWLDSNGTLPFPGGESRDDFCKRTYASFLSVCKNAEMRGAEKIAVLCHGGNIMALMSTLTGQDYFSFQVKCGEGFCLKLSFTGDQINVISYDCIHGRRDS